MGCTCHAHRNARALVDKLRMAGMNGDPLYNFLDEARHHDLCSGTVSVRPCFEFRDRYRGLERFGVVRYDLTVDTIF